MKKVAILFIVLLTSSFIFAQNTYVPDDKFEQALIDLGYDTTLDDYVLTANISGVTTLDVDGKEISDLTGIEAFTALTWLECSDNQLTSLDVSANTALTNLHFSQNQLTSLDLSNNTALTGLACYGNKLTSLDLSNNTALTGLYSNTNQLTNLDLSNNTALTNLHIGSNQLTNLDISKNTALTELFCAYNQLTSLDVSKNTALTSLECWSNKLTSLDVSANTALTSLYCGDNDLTSLDVSANTALTNLHFNQNQLTSMDLSKNTALTYLRCDVNQLTSLDVTNNTALIYLETHYNSLTSLDVSNNTNLTHLNCQDNQLTILDVSINTALTILECGGNKLISLDVSNNTALARLECQENQLTSLNVSSNTALTDLACESNKLTSLDVSSNTALTYLYCKGNQITSLDVSSNIALTELSCWGNQLTYLNMRNGITDALKIFNATNNPNLTCIETLDPTWATANLTSAKENIDAGVTFAVICGATAVTTWHVDTTGSDGSGSGTEASPLASIQTAINATTTGDTVSVATGTYVENINFSGKNIAVIGADRETTIINPSDYIKPVVDFYGDAYGEMSASLLSNFTISGSGYSPESNYGALRIVYGPRPRIEECIFVNNYKVLRIDAAAPTFNNNLFYNNDVLIDWGPNSSPENYNTKFNKCTFLNNPEFGDSENQINPIFIENSIVDSISTISLTGNYVVTFSNIDGGYIGDGNIDVDPMFVDTANGNYHLLASSQLINGGHPDSLDSDGSRADIGAYYYHNEYSGPTWYITESGNDTTATGASGDPFRSIQAGINFSSDDDSVTVAAGTYVENINFSGKNIAVIGADRETTIIDGNESGSVVTFENGEGSTAVLSGFTIQNGSVSGDFPTNGMGGGVFINGLDKETSLDNKTSPILDNLVIFNNRQLSGNGGGGLAIVGNSSTLVRKSKIYSNSATRGGGIFTQSGATPTFENLLIFNNASLWGQGAGIYFEHGAIPVIVNVTIVNNQGCGISLRGTNESNESTIPVILNSIIWGNSNGQMTIEDAESEDDPGNFSILYSVVDGGESGIDIWNNNGTYTWGDGNIDADPMFVDTANGNYHLKDWSPAIGAGTASGAPTTDIEGKQRGSNPDMGAYENQYGSPQNAPPVLSEITDVSVNEDESITVTLEAINADSADNDAITFSASSEKTEVKLSMGSVSGKVNISADENWNGLSKISVEATDGTAFDYGNFTVTFLPVNDKPVIASIASDTTNEETAKSIQVTASDIDGDELSISATTSNNHLVPSVSGMTLSLTPAKDFVGNALVTVIVSDGSLTDTVSYQFTVLNVNDSPVLSEIKDQRIAEDTDIMVKVVATDVDDTSLSFTGNAGSAGISAAFSGNDLTLKPEANWNGSSVITVYASDGKDMDSTKFNLTVDPMQDKPYNFNWVSTALDTINISQSNLTDTYDLQWNTSNEVDGEVVDYLIYAQIGRTQVEMVHDTTDTSYAITYQEFVVKAFEAFPMLSRATVKFSLEATDGIDTVKVTGDDRVVFVNRYEYLSTVSEGIPTVFALHENYPNPFNPTTTLRFDLPEVTDVTVTIYNMLGQRVRTFNMNDTPAGFHSIKWNATNDYGDPVGAGVYLYQLRANQFVKTRKMVLLK